MSKKHQALVSISMALAIMGVLFYSSSMSYQDQSLISWIGWTLKKQPFAEPLSKISFEYAGKLISIPTMGYAQFIEFFIRKSLHFICFLFIGLNWTKGLQVYMKYKWSSYALALFISVMYAVLDEFHQGLVPGRTPLIQDVFLDSIGATVGTVFAFIKR